MSITRVAALSPSHGGVLTVVAVVLFGLSSSHVVTSRAAFAVLVGTLVLVYGAFTLLGSRTADRRPLAIATLVAVALFTALALYPMDSGSHIDLLPTWVRIVCGVTVVTATMFPQTRTRTAQRFIGGVLISVVSIVALVHVAETADLHTDVIYGHREAAAVMSTGGNPYADARFPDTGPGYANIGMIEGYAYPPITLIPYVAAEWAGEARWAGVAAMAVVLSLLLVVGSRRSELGLAITGLALTYPMLGAIYAHGWTEALSLMLIILAALAIRSPVWGGVLSGLAIGSKQYMALAFGPLCTLPGPGRVRRLVISALVAGASVVPFAMWDFGSLWHALIGAQFERVQRLDTLSVAQFGLSVPIFVALAVSVSLGVALGATARTRGSLLVVQAASLAVYFTLSPNTFRNYYFIVALMLVGALALESADQSDREAEVSREAGELAR